MNGISVVICAFNSADRIRPTLEALARCRADFSVEIIVVDNNSSDDTAGVAAEIWKAAGNSSFAFSVVREAHAGLAYARRAGTRAASHDVIVFCDDDNWLDEDYLIQARRIMADRSIGAAGGCSTPTNPERLPPWFYTFSWGYAVGVPFNKIEVLPDDSNTELPISAVWGAGVVVRREALELLFALPGFPALSGRQGTALLSGEDLEMCACLAFAGYKLVFSTALRFRHDISAERIDLAYAKKLFANFSSGFEITGYYRMIVEALDRPWRTSVLGFGRIAKHALSGKLNRGSFLSVIAALRLPVLLTNDQRRVYHIVHRLRSERLRSGIPRLHRELSQYLYAQPK